MALQIKIDGADATSELKGMTVLNILTLASDTATSTPDYDAVGSFTVQSNSLAKGNIRMELLDKNGDVVETLSKKAKSINLNIQLKGKEGQAAGDTGEGGENNIRWYVDDAQFSSGSVRVVCSGSYTRSANQFIASSVIDSRIVRPAYNAEHEGNGHLEIVIPFSVSEV